MESLIFLLLLFLFNTANLKMLTLQEKPQCVVWFTETQPDLQTHQVLTTILKATTKSTTAA